MIISITIIIYCSFTCSPYLCFIIYICYMTILYIILALVAGTGATYLLFQGKLALLQSQLAQASQDQTKVASLEAENRTLFGKLSQIEGQNETLKMTVENQK